MSSKTQAILPETVNGLVLADKPSGTGSAALVAKVKRYTGAKKAGHAGTLDRFAEGLMLIMTGKATVFSDYLLHMDKTYEAVIQVGSSTDTIDPNGSITEQWSPAKVSEYLENSPNRLTINGSIEDCVHIRSQVPPDFSAIKLQGMRASDRIRRGEDITLKERPVRIYEAQCKEIRSPYITAAFHVSSGTYIRSIVRDLSQKLQVPMHLNRLVRTSVGPFLLEDAGYSLQTEENGLPVSALSIKDFLNWPVVTVSGADVDKIKNGILPEFAPGQLKDLQKSQPVDPGSDSFTDFLLTGPDGSSVAWCRYFPDGENRQIRFKKVLTG